MTDPAVTDTEGAATILLLSPSTLKTLRSRGGGPPFHRLGRRVVYALTDLNSWLATHRVAEPSTTD